MVTKPEMADLVQQFLEATEAKAKVDTIREEISVKLVDFIKKSKIIEMQTPNHLDLGTGNATFSDFEADTDEAGYESL